MPKSIVVEILNDGSVRIEGIGFVDGECAKYIEALQDALGGPDEVVSKKNKPEFYRRTNRNVQEIKQQGEV